MRIYPAKPASNSYMWVQVGGPPGKPVVIYDYDPSRAGAVPLRLLQDYRGYIMTDGYDDTTRWPTPRVRKPGVLGAR
jgi:hypothetical protein